MKTVTTTPFTRGYLKGLTRALNDVERLKELAREGRGHASWLAGLDVASGWLSKLVELRAVNAADCADEPGALPDEAKGPDTPALEPPQPEAPGDSR